jgi:Bacterial capsule synthesis protein PGA_cap
MPTNSHDKNPRYKNLKLTLFLLVTILVFATIVYFTNIRIVDNSFSNINNNFTSKTSTLSVSVTSSYESSKEPEFVNLNTLFFGDVFWGRYIDDWSKASPLNEAYPFSGLNTFDRELYDAWIADLECPITDQYINSTVQEDTLSFSCLPEYLPEAAKWFDAFTLANNHTDNMQSYLGQPYNGFEITKNYLDINKIQYFGHYDNSQKNDICEIVSFKSKSENVSIPFAMCGFHNVFKLPTQEQIDMIQVYSQYLPTVVMPHQGREYLEVADDLQRDYARSYIDAGADLVVGDHVHVVQDSEVYKNKLIIYSTGNFIFDQQRGNTTLGIGLNALFRFTNDNNFQKLTEIGSKCTTFKDNCLDLIKFQQLKKPIFTVEYKPIGTDNSNKLAKKASPEVEKLILEKLKWNSTKSKLE